MVPHRSVTGGSDWRRLWHIVRPPVVAVLGIAAGFGGMASAQTEAVNPAAAGVGTVPVAPPTAVTQPAPLPQPATLPTPGTLAPLDLLRNPLLSPGPGGPRVPTVPTPATKQKLDKHVQSVIDPETTFDLVAGQSRTLVLKSNVFRVQAGDERLVAVSVINPREVIVHGKDVGSTIVSLWFGDANDPTKQETLTYLVRIYPDPEAKERLERAYKALENDLNRYFTDADVKLTVLGDKLVVSGRVRDAQQGVKILRIINATTNGSTMGGGDAARVPVDPPMIDPAGGLLPTAADSYRATGGPNVINLLEVAGEQQVALKVVVAEVNRAAARSIGMNFSVTNNQGVTVFSNSTGPVVGFGGGLGAGGVGGGLGGGLGGLNGLGGLAQGGAIANLHFNVDAGRLPFALNALKNLSYSTSLAEPVLVTMNGQPARFQAGGQFPVPVIGGFGGFGGQGGGLQGVQFVPYGVQLAFTPYITDRDRIRLNLSAVVSARDLSAGTSIGGGMVAGLNTRNVQTTVELRQGETLAVAGLIEANRGSDTSRIPIIGELPIVASLTGLTRGSAGEKELVIFITPELVRPLDPGTVLPLPGDDILEPNDFEFYILSRMEGHCKTYRSPIRTDRSRVRQYWLYEQAFVAGPSGYTPFE